MADKFVAMLVGAREEICNVGNGLEAGVEMGPSVDETQMNTVLRYIEIGKKEGEAAARRRALDGGANTTKAILWRPRSSTMCAANSAIAQEEIFGPVLSIDSGEGFRRSAGRGEFRAVRTWRARSTAATRARFSSSSTGSRRE